MDQKKVVLAEEGTLLADFQKARTIAMTDMFERDKGCGQLHSTSQLYADLDEAFSVIVAKAEERVASILEEKRKDLKQGLSKLETKGQTPSKRIINGKLSLLKELEIELLKHQYNIREH